MWRWLFFIFLQTTKSLDHTSTLQLLSLVAVSIVCLFQGSVLHVIKHIGQQTMLVVATMNSSSSYYLSNSLSPPFVVHHQLVHVFNISESPKTISTCGYCCNCCCRQTTVACLNNQLMITHTVAIYFYRIAITCKTVSS